MPGPFPRRLFLTAATLAGFGTAVSIGAAGFYYYQSHRAAATPASVYQLLGHYGYTTEPQKQALLQLIALSGVLGDQTFYQRFPKRADTTALVSDLLDFVALTQQCLTIRTGTQERWDVATQDWMQQHQATLAHSLSVLGVTEAIVPPTQQIPDLAVVLGARYSTMAQRMGYLNQLIQQGQISPRAIAGLAGERYLTFNPPVDGSPEALQALAAQHGIPVETLTETHLMADIWAKSPLSQQSPAYPWILIDTPRGNLPRPTTQTTVRALFEYLRTHPDLSARTVVFISNQPHAAYQRAVIAQTLFDLHQQYPGYDFLDPGQIQMAAPGIPGELTLSQVKEGIGAVGSALWAQSPFVMQILLNDQPLTPTQTEQMRTLYKGNPLALLPPPALAATAPARTMDSPRPVV
jgi:hypothetical protein